jgi:predicted HicB family RNase H-like nuclease
MKQIILRVPDEVHKNIKTAAALTEQSMQELILDALIASDSVRDAIKKMDHNRRD